MPAKIKTVEVKGQRYFVNQVPEEFEKKPEWFLAQHKINVFFAKHLNEYVQPAAEMRSWFNDKNQPTESQVRRAMIWGYDQFGDYQIKAGGGAIADNIFISQLKITIEDSRTGFDKDVILLKKYSNNFDEVLITIDEVQKLEDLTESKARKNTMRLHLLPSMLREIIRWEKGVKSMGNGKGDWTEANINQMKKQCREDYTRDEFQNALQRLSEYARNFENKSLIGGTGAVFLQYVESAVFQTVTVREPETLKERALSGRTLSVKGNSPQFHFPISEQISAQPTLF